MGERMFLEHLFEAYGFMVIIQLMEMICDAKAAENAVSGHMNAAKQWAARADMLEGIRCGRH